MTDIQSIDKNLKVESTIQAEGLRLYDTRKPPFKIYGLYKPTEVFPFTRMPADIAATVNPGVKYLTFNTAGGRVRFSTDSPYIVIKAVMPKVTPMQHMPLTGTSAFDLYEDFEDGSRSVFVKNFAPPAGMKDGYESKIQLESQKLRHFTVNFPLYNPLDSLYIGIKDGSVLTDGLPYADIPPVVYYGSSITQGGCASRPGNCYQGMIHNAINADYINLGFSGNGKGEMTMVEYLASLDMSAFVCDYDHNSPDPEHLEATHERLVCSVRCAHPTTPIIMLTRPDFCQYHNRTKSIEQSTKRREIVFATYEKMRSAGDENVYFIDGETFFEGDFKEHCTVDGCHPNDLGFHYMAKAILPVLKKVLNM